MYYISICSFGGFETSGKGACITKMIRNMNAKQIIYHTKIYRSYILGERNQECTIDPEEGLPKIFFFGVSIWNKSEDSKSLQQLSLYTLARS